MNDDAVARRVAILAEKVSFHYPDGTSALRDVSLMVEPGEVVCLAGPNGAGKSTLLLLLAGILKGQGQTLIHGTPPEPGTGIGIVFQDPDDQLFCPTVGEDVAFGPRNQGLSERDVDARVKDALQKTGLSGFEKRSAHHLSGGEKKRAAIAAVLACSPEVLAFDEPWANLDARGALAVTEIARGFTGTLIVASQDLYRASEVCDRIIVLDGGRIVGDSPMRDMLADSDFLALHGLEFGMRCRFCPVVDADPFASIRE